MAQRTIIKYKSERYFADERRQLWQTYSDIVNERYENKDEATDDALLERLNKALDDIGRIDLNALQAYYADINGDTQTIISDAKDMIKQIKTDFLQNYLLLLYADAVHTQVIGDAAEAGETLDTDTAAEAVKERLAYLKDKEDDDIDYDTIFDNLLKTTKEAFLSEQYGAAKQAYKEKKYDNAEYESVQDTLTELLTKKLKSLIAAAGGIKILAYKEIDDTDVKETLSVLEDAQNNNATLLPEFIKSSSYVIPNSKVANRYMDIQHYLSASKNTDTDGQLTLVFSQEKVPVNQGNPLDEDGKVVKTIQVKSLVSLQYTGDLPPKLAKLNAYDKTVLNAVCSIYFAGNTFTSVNAIFKVMNGNTTREPKEEQKKKILASLEKLNNIVIYIDFSDEVKNKYITLKDAEKDERVKDLHVKDRLIQYREIDAVTTKGRQVRAIQIFAEPILMTYSKMKARQEIMTIPADMLNIESISLTDYVIVLKEYLAKEITQIKKGARNNSLILFDTIFNECGLTDKYDTDEKTNRSKLKRYRETVLKIFAEWKKKGYIDGYKTQDDTGKLYDVDTDKGKDADKGIHVRGIKVII